VTEIAGWYATLRSMLDDDPDDLTRVERLLHGFGYVLAHGLFLGASSPERVVRRLRLAYRSVGVSIDDTASEAGAERTTFTCPYRDVGARIYGEKWVCHEKLDRVDDGYVTYLAKRVSTTSDPGAATGARCVTPPSRATGLSCGGRRPPPRRSAPTRDPRSSRVAVDTVATALRGRVATGGRRRARGTPDPARVRRAGAGL